MLGKDLYPSLILEKDVINLQLIFGSLNYRSAKILWDELFLSLDSL